MGYLRKLQSIHTVKYLSSKLMLAPDWPPKRQSSCTANVSHQITRPQYRDVDLNSISRSITTWPSASDVYYELAGGPVNDVSQIEVLGYSIPNVLNGINSNNNVVSWRNEEDLGTAYSGHTYSIKLAASTYNFNNIIIQLQTQMSLVPRMSDGTLHTWIVNGVVDTQSVQFISYKNSTLDLNPFVIVAGSPVVTITQTAHNHLVGDTILISGVTGFPGGLDASSYIGELVIVQIVSVNTFAVQISSIPYNNDTGGGSAVTVGVRSAFKLIKSANSIFPTLGFADEDSALRLPPSMVDPIHCCSFMISSLSQQQSTDLVSITWASCTGVTMDVLLSLLQIGDQIMLDHQTHFTVNDPPINNNDGTLTVCCILPQELQNQSIQGIVGQSVILPYLAVDLPTNNASFGSSMFPTNTSLKLQQVRVTQDGEDYVTLDTVIKATTTTQLLLRVSVTNSVGRVLQSKSNPAVQSWGGSNVRLDSDQLGYDTVQGNFVNGVVYQEINLAGDPACYITTPDLEADTDYCSGNVSRILLRVPLEQGAGNIIQSNTLGITDKTFYRHPIKSLSGIRLQIRTASNQLVAFRSLNWSICLRIHYK